MKKRIIFCLMFFGVMFCALQAQATEMSINEFLNGYRILENSNRSVSKMQDGFIDAFVDKCGINYSNTSYVDFISDDNDDIIALVHFDESKSLPGYTSDLTSDVSQNCQIIELKYDATIDTSEGYFGGASLYVDGSGDHAAILNDEKDFLSFSSTTSSLSIDFWVKLDGQYDNQYFFSGWAPSNNLIRYYMASYDPVQGSMLQFFLKDGSNIINLNTGYANGNSIEDDDWYHVAFIKEGTEFGIYLDGSQKAHVSSTVTTTLVEDSPIFIGQIVDTVYMKGNIDEFRVSSPNVFGIIPDTTTPPSFTVPTAPAQAPEKTSSYLASQSGQTFTLVSETFEAESTPTSAKVMLLAVGDDLTNDLTVSVARNGSTGTFDAASTITDVGEYQGNIRIIEADVSLTSTSTNDLVYKVTAPGTADIEIHGIGFSWE